MALRDFKLLSFIFLLYLLFSSNIGHAKRDTMSNDNIVPSPFEFINHLKGCHKGNKTKEIHQLKNYLHEFGYLDQMGSDDDDEYDDALESAIKTYQNNFHLNPTGILDANTVSKMVTPRCGVPDITKGRNPMGAKNKTHDSNLIHTVSHYGFFDNHPRWPPSKTHLTYYFSPNTPREATAPVSRAFDKWARETHFTFSMVQSLRNADLVIGFYGGDHGDDYGFDGRGGILAHAAAPTDGKLHFDADEKWVIGMVAGGFDVETVALHEIGHLLGLGHSSIKEAIMFPSISPGTTKNLGIDDITGIGVLYGVKLTSN